MTDYRALLLARISGDKRYSTRVPLCLDPDAAQALQDAEEAYGQAVLEAERTKGQKEPTRSLADRDPVETARKARDKAQKAVRDASVNLVLKALPEQQYAAMRETWAARGEDEPDTSNAEMLKASLLAVEALDGKDAGLTPDDVLNVLPYLSSGEVGRIITAAVRATQNPVDLDFLSRR